MVDHCWANVVDGGPTLVKHWVKHWVDVPCLLEICCFFSGDEKPMVEQAIILCKQWRAKFRVPHSRQEACFIYHIIYIIAIIERDVAQWLERGALPMSLPAVRFRIPLGAGFSEKYYVSPLSILGHYSDVVSLGKTLYPHMLHLTQV